MAGYQVAEDIVLLAKIVLVIAAALGIIGVGSAIVLLCAKRKENKEKRRYQRSIKRSGMY